MKQYNDPKGQAGSLKAPLGLVPPYAMEQTSWVHKLGAEKYGRKIPVLACSTGEELAEFCTCGYSTQNQSVIQKDLTQPRGCATSVTTNNTQDQKKPHVMLEELLGQGGYANPVTTSISEKVIHLISKNKKVQQMLGLTPTKSMLEKNQVNGINDQMSENEIYSLTEKELSFLLDLLLTTKPEYSRNKIMDVLFAGGLPDGKVFSTSTMTIQPESSVGSSATAAIKDLACSETILNLFKKHSPTCGVQSLIVREGEIEQYGAFNWRRTGVCASTYIHAILRHLNAWRDGESLDPESGITHLAHIACSANILMDAEVCGKLQDDRNKRPTSGEAEDDERPKWWENDEEISNYILKWIRGEDEERPTSGETEEGSLKVGELMTVSEFAAALRKDLEDFGFELAEDTVPEYRVLKEGEFIQEGDEFFDEQVGEWKETSIVKAMEIEVEPIDLYRRKVADCDLEGEPPIKYRVETTTYRKLEEGDKLQDGDEVYVGEDHWLPVYVSDWMTPAIVNGGTYRRKVITNCDLKDKVADCDLKEESPIDDECKCGRRKIYHWLYGYICEDCDLKYPDPQP